MMDHDPLSSDEINLIENAFYTLLNKLETTLIQGIEEALRRSREISERTQLAIDACEEILNDRRPQPEPQPMKSTDMLKAEDAAAADPARDMSKPLPSFAVHDLSVLAYANGFTLWHQKVATIADAISSNYFNAASDMMAAGDHVHVSAPDGGAILFVAKADGGGVSVRKIA